MVDIAYVCQWFEGTMYSRCDAEGERLSTSHVKTQPLTFFQSAKKRSMPKSVKGCLIIFSKTP